MGILTKLSDDLAVELKKADEIWVAVGLINFGGLDFILAARQESKTLRY